MGVSEERFPVARRIGTICGKTLARFGIGTFQGYRVLFAPVYPNVGAVPLGPLGLGVESFLVCNSFVWRQHLKGRRWATSILMHEVGHLKDFAAHPWQLAPLILLRIGAPRAPSVRVLLNLLYLYLEGKANLRALEQGASPIILAVSYLSYSAPSAGPLFADESVPTLDGVAPAARQRASAEAIPLSQSGLTVQTSQAFRLDVY